MGIRCDGIVNNSVKKMLAGAGGRPLLIYHVGDPESAGLDRANYRPLLNSFGLWAFLEK